MTNFYLKIGRVVAYLRRAKGMSQGDLAAVLGLSRASITNMEVGRQTISLQQFDVLRRYFEVSADQLLDTANLPGILAKRKPRRIRLSKVSEQEIRSG